MVSHRDRERCCRTTLQSAPASRELRVRWQLNRNGFIDASNYTSEPEQRVCQNRAIRGTFRNTRITGVSAAEAWFRIDCDEEFVTANRQIPKCRRYQC